MSVVKHIADPYMLRENERLASQAQSTQAQLDYLYMVSGVEPMEAGDERSEHGGEQE